MRNIDVDEKVQCCEPMKTTSRWKNQTSFATCIFVGPKSQRQLHPQIAFGFVLLSPINLVLFYLKAWNILLTVLQCTISFNESARPFYYRSTGTFPSLGMQQCEKYANYYLTVAHFHLNWTAIWIMPKFTWEICAVDGISRWCVWSKNLCSNNNSGILYVH